LHPAQADVRSEIRIGTEQPAIITALRVRVEMHDLLQRVDTGISESGRRRMDRMIGDTAKRAFERRMQRLLSGQRLQATIAGRSEENTSELQSQMRNS